MKKSSLLVQVLRILLGIFILFALWFLLYFVVANNGVVPMPIIVIKNSFKLFLQSEFYTYLFATLFRVLLATIISISLALIFAVLSYLVKGFSNVMLPIVAVLRSMPTFPILLVIFSITIFLGVPRGVVSVIVCILTLFPIFYSTILNNLLKVNKNTKDMLKVYGVSVKDQVYKVYIKGLLPLIIKEFFTGLSFALKLIVSAEILTNLSGSVGGKIEQAFQNSQIELLMALTLIICIIAIICEILGKFIYKKMVGKYL